MLQRGAVLSGKYRIDGVLGEGGMAVVYAVTHVRNNARSAVKVLHAGSARKNNIRTRFVREGMVANSVDHPGVVEMIDDGVAEDGSPYLVMEHLKGVSLDELSSRSIPLSAALNIAYQVLDVLRAAHDNGIIHRDIKPANLFLLRDGQVKVLDFGISRLRDGPEPTDSQATGSAMGTPFFMAPEQARGDASEIDTRTDLFGVGATLFRLISGTFLHTGEGSLQVTIQAANQRARSLDSVAPGTPRAVVELVAQAVAYDRAARWGSAEAMQEAVRQVHEALFGTIEAETLATLVLTREFRSKSHARLTAARRLVPWAETDVAPSPLSTTLPAVAGETRSVESFRPSPESAPDAESSRISAEPVELAGWTGQVPAAKVKSGAGGSRITSRFGGSLNTRVVQIGVVAFVLCTAALFGFPRTEPQSIAGAGKTKVAPEAPPPVLVHAASANTIQAQTATFASTPPAAEQPVNAARPIRPHAPVKPTPAPDHTSVSAPPPPPVPPTTAASARLHISPVLIRTVPSPAP